MGDLGHRENQEKLIREVAINMADLSVVLTSECNQSLVKLLSEVASKNTQFERLPTIIVIYNLKSIGKEKELQDYVDVSKSKALQQSN